MATTLEALALSSAIHASLARLCIGGAVGAIAYLLLSAWFNRRWLAAMLELVLPGKSHWITKLDRKVSSQGPL